MAGQLPLWRVKQQLQGRLSSARFEPEVMEEYGRLLLSMGDDLEAGRMLFASGARKPEYGEPIALFLSRHSRKNPEQFLSALPRMVRKHKHLADLLASMEFESEGWSAETHALLSAPQDVQPVKRSATLKSRLMSGLVMFNCLFDSILERHRVYDDYHDNLVSTYGVIYSAARITVSSTALASPGTVFISRSGKATMRLPVKSACSTTSPCSSK